MASAGKGNRWGSLLSQAVAGVEARLDAVLAESEEAGKQPKTTAPPPQKPKQGPARPSSAARTNDRLQERLARAVAAKNANGSRGPSPAAITRSPRSSIDTSRTSIEKEVEVKEVKETETETETRPTDESKENTAEETTGRIEDDEPAQPVDTPALDTTTTAPQLPSPTTETPAGPDNAARIQTLEQTLEEERRQHQEEAHHLAEKADALQAKLQYLAHEAAEAAKKAADEAAPGSLEKKLAEKDQQIAALMQEGKNLGVTELQHRALLKKMRAKMTEDEKAANELRAARAKADSELLTLRPRARRAGDLEKALERAQEDGRRQLAQAQKELAAREATVTSLQTQLQAAVARADAAKAKAQDEALEAARKRTQVLEEQVATLQLEKTLAADRARTQAVEWREKAERAEERARAVEAEAAAEVLAAESKLEAMRARAEEASSGALGDSQAKLLRQVETLQSQHAIASENWHGIEATLLARLASLEKERDEAQHRESEMRKKAREASLRAKRLEEDLEEVRARLPRAQEDASVHEAQLAALKKRAQEAEAALQQTREDLESQRTAMAEKERERERGRARDLPEPSDLRRTWLDDLPGRSTSNSRPASPLVQTATAASSLAGPTRTWSAEFLGLQSLPNKLRKASAPSSHDDPAERFSLRRPSVQPPSRTNTGGLLTLSPIASPMASPIATETVVQSPVMASAIAPEDAVDDGLERSTSPLPSMPNGTSQAADLVSVSTVAAGPSVQLVERMSAAIRRLESEKVAAREELARISSQRNEARKEVLTLLKDSEAGRTAAARVTELEAEVAAMQDRYETTLVLLGEKSELVEELRSDVQDVKAMYRDLVERSVGK